MIHIGTSGWQYHHWLGPFYPHGTKQNELFAFYSKHFATVELNNPFYHLPKKSSFEKWNDQAPSGFVFAVKASRYITHLKKLRDAKEPLEKMLDNYSGLGEKLGPILFQLPPRWHYNHERLSAFLDLVPANIEFTFEFRDHTWLHEECYGLLRERGVAFCIHDLAGFQSPLEVTADYVYIRLHGPAPQKYQGSYSEQQLQAWAERIRKWAGQGKRVCCYFDNDDQGFAPRNAARLRKMVE